MAEPKEQLCIITPDNFYGVMLAQAVFPTFEVRVIKGSESIQSLVVNFYPSAFVLFSEHLGPTGLAKILIQIRSHFPQASVYQIEGLREPRLQLLWSKEMTVGQRPETISISNVDDIDRAIRALSDGAVELITYASLTNSQKDVLRLLAEGLTNKEIADARKTSIRAVETLLNRAFMRIAVEVPASSRGKMALAQRYLGWRF